MSKQDIRMHSITKKARLSAAIAAAWACSGCTILADPDESQCEQNVDCSFGRTGVEGLVCGSRNLCVPGGSEGVDWDCLGSTTGPRAAESLQLRWLDNGNDRPIVGMSVEVCSSRDVGCEDPVDSATTDAAGLTEVTIPVTNLISYALEAAIAGYKSTIVYEADDWRVVNDDPQFTRFDYRLLSDAGLNLLLSSASATQDADAGHLIITSLDCDGVLAPGVRFGASRMGTNTVTVYGRGETASTTATETSAEDGWGGFLNLPEGLVTVISTNDQDQAIGNPQPVLIRRDWVTLLFVRPRQP